MKLKALLILSSLIVSSAHALTVNSVTLDASKQNLLVSVTHSGGCGDHSYELVLSGCFESMPAQCNATIKHKTNDICQALITKDIKFNLRKYGLTDSYYEGAKLTIKGDHDSMASVKLPRKSQSANPVKAKGIQCKTHTGSDLVITDKQAILTTVNNEVAVYSFMDIDFRVLESLPPIYQTIYKLNDGRSIQLDFRGESKTGTGEFIRTDGSRSPEFSCKK